MKKIILTLLFMPTILFAHPDDSVPYYYPSAFIYGYINGCADQVEKNQLPFTEQMWPAQVREVCGCVVDAFRHSLTFEEISDNKTNDQAVMIATATFPICVNEQLKRQ